MHYFELSHKCGGLRTDSDWLDGIKPNLACRCGYLTAARKIKVRLPEELDFPMLYSAFFERSYKIRSEGKIKSVGRNVDKGGIVPIVDREMISSLGTSCFEDSFFIGDVEFSRVLGKRNFASLVPKSNDYLVIVRGSRNSGVEVCSKCRKYPIYSIGLPYEPYILVRNTLDFVGLLATPNGSILIRSDLLDGVSRFLSGMNTSKIEVLEKPVDDLPENLLELSSDFKRPITRPT